MPRWELVSQAGAFLPTCPPGISYVRNHALERVLERKGFIARHSGLRLCWPSLAIIGLLGLPFSVVFFAQFGLAFLLVFHGLGFQAFFLRLS